MGNRLAKEKQRLNILMIVLAISYVGTSLFYLIQVATQLNCTRYDLCSRFTNVMLRCGIQFFFDIIPIAVLYHQHYQTSQSSLNQLLDSQQPTINSSTFETKNTTESELMNSQSSKFLDNSCKSRANSEIMHMQNVYSTERSAETQADNRVQDSNSELLICCGDGETVSSQSNTMSQYSLQYNVRGTLSGN